MRPFFQPFTDRALATSSPVTPRSTSTANARSLGRSVPEASSMTSRRFRSKGATGGEVSPVMVAISAIVGARPQTRHDAT